MTEPKHSVVREGAKFIGVVPADSQLVSFMGKVFVVSPMHPPMEVTPDGLKPIPLPCTLVTTF